MTAITLVEITLLEKPHLLNPWQWHCSCGCQGGVASKARAEEVSTYHLLTKHSSAWRCIESKYPKRHTVYWNRSLGDGRRLTVGRVYNEDGSFTPGGPWEWKIYGPNHHPKRPEILASGRVNTVLQGKTAAQAAL